MTRQLTVKLKFEVEEKGGVTTALLRGPGELVLRGQGPAVQEAIDDLFTNMMRQGRNSWLVHIAWKAAQEATLAALWTP